MNTKEMLKLFKFDSPESTYYYIKKNDAVTFPKFTPSEYECRIGENPRRDHCFRVNDEYFVPNYDMIDNQYLINNQIEELREKIVILLNNMEEDNLHNWLKNLEILKKFPLLKIKHEEDLTQYFEFQRHRMTVMGEKTEINLCEIVHSKKKSTIDEKNLELNNDSNQVIEEKLNKFEPMLSAKSVNETIEDVPIVKIENEGLTEKQIQVLTLLRGGKTKSEIAKILNCSLPNVTHICSKLKLPRLPISAKEKQAFFKAFDSKCAMCKGLEPLQIHHIDGNRSNKNYKNLIPLCPNCHTKKYPINQLRAAWKPPIFEIDT